MGRLFGTDGVRGVANKELTSNLAFKLGRAGAYVLSLDRGGIPKILVGSDTRLSCDMLEAALVSGICSVGAQAITCGVVPTPAISSLVKKYNCDAGVVISASHNPFEYNGIKFFSNTGCKLPDEVEDRIEKIILEEIHDLPTPIGKDIGVKIACPDALLDYMNSVKDTLHTDISGLKVAIDCSNGACSVAGPQLLNDLGIELTVINNTPDGININKRCGSTHMESLMKLVKENDFDIGIAFDGDADRMLACDENGCFIDGDKIMAILATQMKLDNTLKQDTIVATVMSNIGLDVYAKETGMKITKTKVGDRYVLEEMLDKGYSIGGEQSGHIILLDHNTTGDGLLTAVQLLQVLKTTGKKASELAGIMQVYPQVLKNAKVRNDNKYLFLEDLEISEMCNMLQDEFKGEGRVLIRPSGTEPLVRVMIEGKDQEYITKKAAELAELIERRLGPKKEM